QYDEDTPIMLICASGNRSSMAADSLAKNGYTNVANVQGGMYAWQSNRLPVE
ncbi:MAG: rhodanese-like domain-containing protein, partial [Candidatus Marinimicrobia bacterium]|nr:rhodanese-like domain-containing protein [Candidatus Neomarinimicrobiota bacterium]